MDILTTLHNHDRNPKHRQKVMMKIVVLLLALLAITLLVKCCKALVSNKARPTNMPMLIRKDHSIFIPEKSPLRSQMIVQAVTTSKRPHIVVFPGIVEADASLTVNVLPPLAGHLVDLNVKLGDEVKKDQVLAIMQSSGLAQAHSDLIKAQSILKQAKDTLQRAQKVNRAGANAVKDIEQAQSNYTQARAEVHRAQEVLKSLGNNEPYKLRIQAPIDGKIIALNYGKGSYINDPTTAVLTVSNIQSVWVTASIPEHLIALVSKGLPVQVSMTAYPKQIWKGKVAFINPLIDPDTRSNKTRIAFNNPNDKLQPNMFARVRMALPEEEQVIVPLSAILMNDDTTSIYVETAPWTFEPRAVELGVEDKNSVRIISGLKSGDRIVVSGGILVND